MSNARRHAEPNRKRFVAAVIVGGVLCGFAATWLYLVKHRDLRNQSSSAVTLMAAERLRSGQEHLWASAPLLDLSTADPREIEAWMKDAVMPAAGLPEDAAQTLASTIAGHVVARASADPGDYLKLAESEGTRWSQPSNPMAWEAIQKRYEFVTKKPADPSDLRGILRALIDAGNRLEGSRYTKVASDGASRRIEVRRIRTVDEADAGLFNSVEDHQYWLGNPSHNAFRLRVPERSLLDVLSEHGWTWYAEVRLIVEMERGSRAGWLSTWYWDPRGRRWNNRSMTLRSWSLHGTFY